MTCPNCKGEMLTGVISMKKPLLEFLAFGYGTRCVYFTADETRQGELVLHWSQRTQAYQCRDCELIVFPKAK